MKVDIDFTDVTGEQPKKELALYELIGDKKDVGYKIVLASFNDKNELWGVCIEGGGFGNVGMYDQSMLRKLPSKTKVTITQE